MTSFTIHRGSAPLLLSIPHAGTEIPAAYQVNLRSLWLARKDTDWWLPELYDFALGLGATLIVNQISRTVIDVNRDPSGISLYPGQFTTGLCPVETFDGEPLYCGGAGPGADEIARRRYVFFEPYHATLWSEVARLRASHRSIVLYDCHSIRSVVPRLFEGTLPHFNIGTNDGNACDPAVAAKTVAICAASSDFTYVANGRFKGGFITRHYGDPARGVNAIQMELACRGYMAEPETLTPDTWPTRYDERYAAPLRVVLRSVLESFLS